MSMEQRMDFQSRDGEVRNVTEIEISQWTQFA